MTKKYKNSKESIEKISKKRFSSVGIITLTLLIFSSAIIYAVNADIIDYFNQSRTADGHGGHALERNSGDFTIDGCGSGTMLDTITGLCWQKHMSAVGASGESWSGAGSYCSGLSLGGHSDWRLPTRNELFTLIDQIGGSGATCTTLESFGFTYCQNDEYWSTTTEDSDSSDAWSLGFDDGNDRTRDKITLTNMVVCVRRN